ncbi:ORF72 [Agrotis segetum granulovirus]|uniref:ORF72 n=1 Tax=Agrotis segetum granulosis virus TaxID=10464 RepID=Q6QXN3_GVAS|nr:ORF72 [Agrotis segetum granulovirus]
MAHDIEYTLRFFKVTDAGVQNSLVTFVCSLNVSEIDTVAFLLAEYFDQQHLFSFERLTFFSQYKHVIEVIKKDYEARTDTDEEVKQIFKLFIENDFIGQVPSFQLIMKSIGSYLHKIPNVDVSTIVCDTCPANKLVCLKCKATYASLGLSVMDASLQEGWDVFFRPMLGIPLLFFALFKSDMSGVDKDVFSVDNIITNILLQFFYNLLCDKATPMYWNFKKCNLLIEHTQDYVRGVSNKSLEYMLHNLNSTTYNTKLYNPLKQFMEQHFSTKQIGKLIHKIFIGFFLRVYLEAKRRNIERLNQKRKRKFNEAADGLLVDVYDLETRNICRVLFKDYDDVEFETFIEKLQGIKGELAIEVCQNLVVPKECVLRLFNKYNLKGDVSKLLQKTVSLA